MLPAFLQDQRRAAADRTPSRLRRWRRRPRRRGCGTDRSSSSATRRSRPAFADHRTYLYKGKEVDQQVHLGFDLAVTAHVPVVAANTGTVLNASWLGIYGNCVILDHGMGVAVAVRPPDVVRRQGRRHGHARADASAAATRPASPAAITCTSRCSSAASMVNPVEWWDPHWIRTGSTASSSEAESIRTAAKGMNRPVVDSALCAFSCQERFNASTKCLGSALGLALAATVVACGGGQETSNKSAEPSSPAGDAGGQKVDTATAGDVKGVVMLDGAAPKNEPIKMNADPVCVKQKQGHRSSRRPTSSATTARRSATCSSTSRTASATTSSTRRPRPRKIDQKDCRYHPHVFGMRVGQPLEIVNSDPTLHNIHAMPKGNTRVQQRPADPGHEDDAHLRQARK